MDTVSSLLDDLMVSVREAHSQLIDRELDLKEQLADVITERRRLDAVIRAAQGPQQKVEEKKPVKKNSVSDEMIDRVKSAIMSLGPEHRAMPDVNGSFTVKDVVETEVASNFTVHTAISEMRERGEVRMVGTLDQPGQPRVWALVGNGDGS